MGHTADTGRKARALGINHVALEVGNLEDALAFYGRIFEFRLRGRAARMAFIDLGDQFIALAEGRSQQPDGERHFVLVVDDKEAVRSALVAAGVKVRRSGGLDFIDPWGNHVQVVQYSEIQFTKAAEILAGMGAGHLQKSAAALEELRQKGLAPGNAATSSR
ncbi:MAG: VOC family protein [Gemmatimonadetes bacterium]|nr:VOC family protein [Gemmatimonadota bacterium]